MTKIMTPEKADYRDDFQVRVMMPAIRGAAAGIPDFDFDLCFSTCRATYTAGRKDGTLVNCRPDGDDLIVEFRNHRLGPYEEIGCLATFHIPDPLAPQGIRNVTRRYETGIVLGNGATLYGIEPEFTLLLPYIKGEKGESLKYSDLTEEEKKELTAEVTDALGNAGLCGCGPLDEAELKRCLDDLWKHDGTVADEEISGSGCCCQAIGESELQLLLEDLHTDREDGVRFEPLSVEEVREIWKET